MLLQEHLRHQEIRLAYNTLGAQTEAYVFVCFYALNLQSDGSLPFVLLFLAHEIWQNNQEASFSQWGPGHPHLAMPRTLGVTLRMLIVKAGPSSWEQQVILFSFPLLHHIVPSVSPPVSWWQSCRGHGSSSSSGQRGQSTNEMPRERMTGVCMRK